MERKDYFHPEEEQAGPRKRAEHRTDAIAVVSEDRNAAPQHSGGAGLWGPA